MIDPLSWTHLENYICDSAIIASIHLVGALFRGRTFPNIMILSNAQCMYTMCSKEIS